MANQEKLAEAYRWLDKAITMEAEGKSKSLVDKCLGKACAYEIEANAA